MVKVVFACVHNAGRSQMAAALFNAAAHPDRARAISAGTNPGERVHPEVLVVMRELGIDLSDVKPQKLTPELTAGASVFVTMGCGDECPWIADEEGMHREDWALQDPKGQPLETVRAIRDDIARRVAAMLACGV